MLSQILTTKLYIPTTRSTLVTRPNLIGKLNKGLDRKLSLISAPAGFGKTTLVSEWISSCNKPIAWLSLDKGDNDPTRFLTYVIAAIQTISAGLGDGVLTILQSPQAPPIESILTTLVNEISAIPEEFILVLDDYHSVDSEQIDKALLFLLEHLPKQMHLVIITREDPKLPLARLRVRGEMTEVRVADLRFSPAEASGFLNQVMGLNLSINEIEVLETRTEGWIAGLQLAAISMQGHEDTTSFIQSFTGSHHFVLDYLLEEVLHQQPENIQTFLLHTSILDRLCGSLCDAVLHDTSNSSQDKLESILHANLFLIPLDNERRWYRYHHLFADLLRQRLQQNTGAKGEEVSLAELHSRASIWYEDKGYEIEAFHHAAAANDVERAERLIEGDGMPLYLRGESVPILSWLETLSETALNASPSLWVTYASTLLFVGQIAAVEPKLQSAELALDSTEIDELSQDLVGRIASMRATLAVIQNDVESIISQSHRALKFLHPDNLSIRTATMWTLGYAHQLQGNRKAARHAYNDVLAISPSGKPSIYVIAATVSLGQIQESENQLHIAKETYQNAINLSGESSPHPIACEAYLGLARISYQWNELDTAYQYGQQCLQLTQQMESVDTIASHAVFLAHLMLARGDVSDASNRLDEAEAFVRQHGFMFRMPDIVSAQVLVYLHQGNLPSATHLANTHNLPISQARIALAQGDPSRALAILEPVHQQAMEKGLQDKLLKVKVLQAVVYHALDDTDTALQVLNDSLTLAKLGGFIRIFVDEGSLMAQLLHVAYAEGIQVDTIRQVLSAFAIPEIAQSSEIPVYDPELQWIDPLSQREIEVLQLIAEGLTNQDIADRLFLSLHTVKVHARNIYSKLDVSNRTQAVAKAQALDILSNN